MVHTQFLTFSQQEKLMKSQVEAMLSSNRMSNDLNELLTTSLQE